MTEQYSFGEFRRWCGEQRSILNKQKDELAFLRTFVDAFRAQIHPDILVIPGKHNNGPPIAAHKALLATRSEIFKNMLESDECIKAEANKSITIPEMGREEVECLLEFLYDGKLSPEKLEKHVYALSLAADKYDIAYLGKVCEKYMVTSLSIGNALDVLEIADTCHNAELKESTMKFLVHNIGDVVLSDRSCGFYGSNPFSQSNIEVEIMLIYFSFGRI
ncbi:BTB/POZ domain-containing protein [Senna tora]|uniref:BTB/POZ domain-containing protein n=1 Tax=Senna tora TaxID=362788 RepID=A0A834TYW4_9FABA|nr:BTB/POZ domain-containing protein [Senna tora]